MIVLQVLPITHLSQSLYSCIIFIRYNMFTGFIGSRDQLTLTSAHLYLTQATLDPFIFFANNVVIKQLSITEESSLQRITQAIQKAFSNFGIKLVPPLRTLAMRVLEGNMGFLQLHTIFLKICRILCAYSEALPVIEYPGMFKNIKRAEQVDFLVEACELCIRLRKFPEAYDFAFKAVRLDTSKEERLVNAFKRFIVLSIYMKKSIREFEENLSRLIGAMQQNLVQITTMLQTPKRDQQLQRKSIELQIFKYYLTLREWRELKEEEQILLQEDGLLEVFNEAKYSGLRTYIQCDIKGLNWRIKSSEIRGENVGSLEVARGVNLAKEIYKYDSEQKMMYFNHKICDQEQLNQLISKAFLMQNEANNCKIDRKEGDFGARLGGLGGFGGFGGFGGGMFAGMGPMMGSSKKRSSRDNHGHGHGHGHDYDD